MTGTASNDEGRNGQIRSAQHQFAAIAAEASTHRGPIHLLELLRFSAHAQYEPEQAPDGKRLTGREAYMTYSSYVSALMERIGAVPVMSSSSNRTMIGPDVEDWDMMIIVRYPSRAAFIEMIESSVFRSIKHHRNAGVADSRLILTEPGG